MKHGRVLKPAIAGLVLLQGAGAHAAPPADSLTSVETVRRLGSHPVTVRLAPGARGGPASPGRAAAVSISLERIEGRALQPVRINVFLDKPDADRNAAVNDPHFLGFVQLMPRRGGVVAPRSHRLAIRGRASCARIRQMTVTLVPVIGVNEAPLKSTLSIGRIYARCERHTAAAI